MKKNYRSVLLVLLVLFAAQVNVMAQNRKTNLELKLLSPTANAVIPYGQQFNVSITIKNNGPDTLRGTDTLAILHSGSQNPVALLVSTLTGGGGLASGATSPTGNLAQLSNNNTTAADQTANFCAILLDINTAGLQLQGGGTLHVTWDDTDTLNNRSCASITLKKQETNSIFDISKDNASLVMGPNPASNEVSFMVNPETASVVYASVKDIQGREIMKKDFGRIASGNTVPLKLDVSGLKNGIYFVELNGAGEKAVGKLVVQH